MTIRTKRVLFVMVFLFLAATGAAIYAGYMLTRDIPFDWENPNFVEANEARRKLRLYDTSVTNGTRGFARLSQLEINSYLMSNSTNRATNVVTGEPFRFKKVGIGLGNTNFLVYSWGETSLLGRPVPFTMMRSFQIRQPEEDGRWDLTMNFMQVGNVEVPREYWGRFDQVVERMDAPLRNEFAWMTNIPAILVRKNELSQRPELRLYTYKPIPPADLR